MMVCCSAVKFVAIKRLNCIAVTLMNNTKLVHWLLMGGLLHIVQLGLGTGRAAAPPSPLICLDNRSADN